MSKWPSQMDVITLMAQGWSLGRGNGFTPTAWIQEGKLGHGGQARDVHMGTFCALLRKGFIKSKGYHFPTEEFVLTEDAPDCPLAAALKAAEGE